MCWVWTARHFSRRRLSHSCRLQRDSKKSLNARAHKEQLNRMKLGSRKEVKLKKDLKKLERAQEAAQLQYG